MIRHENENGTVNVSTSVYTEIVGTAVSNCFGVKGMAARSVTDGVYHLLRPEVPASTGDEALFQCTKPSGVPRGPSHLQFP